MVFIVIIARQISNRRLHEATMSKLGQLVVCEIVNGCNNQNVIILRPWVSIFVSFYFYIKYVH